MNEPLALLLNDIHVHKDNISDFKINWDEMLDVCKKQGISDVVLGGDLWTARSSQTLSTLLSVKSAIEKAIQNDLFLVIAPGNHCKVNLEDFESYSHLFKNVYKNVQVVDDYEILYWEDCNFVLLVVAYFPETGTLLKVLDDAVNECFEKYPEVVKSKQDIVLYCHAGIHGALGNMDIPGEAPQEPFMGFKKVLVAHYHNRCKIKNTPIEYIGSSRPHTFGEDDDKGYTILYSDGSTEFIQNQVNVRYKTFVLNADRLDDFELKKDPRYKYKVQVNCTEKQTKLFDKQKWIEKGFDKVEVIAQSAEETSADASAITEKYDKLGIKKEYQNYCDEKSIDSRLGIKYLEG